MVVKSDGKELNLRLGDKIQEVALSKWVSGMGGWTGGRLGDFAGKAAAEVKATTTATRNTNKFKISDEIRITTTSAAKCRNPILREVLKKKSTKGPKRIRCQSGSPTHRKDCAETCREETLGQWTCQ